VRPDQFRRCPSHCEQIPPQSGKYTASPSKVGVAETSPPVVNTHFGVRPLTLAGLIVCSAGWLQVLFKILSGYSPLAQSQSPEPICAQSAINRTESEQHLEPAGRTHDQPANVSGLTPKWCSQRAAMFPRLPPWDGDAVYFPDWGGNLFAVKKDSGELIWSHKISEYDGVEGAVSRVSPAVEGNQVIIGDLQSPKLVHNGANVISVDRETGTLRWITQVESHPAAIITGSPVVFNGVVYIGVSSTEETLALDPTYPCCSFRGSIVALNEKTARFSGRRSTCRKMAEKREDTAAERFGNRLRLIPSAACSLSVQETTTRRRQKWKRARTRLRWRTAPRLTISSTRRLRWI